MPTYTTKPITFSSQIIPTPLGNMVAIADIQALYLLEFCDKKNLSEELSRLCSTYKVTVIQQNNNLILNLLARELQDYFAGVLQRFTTPVCLTGTDFEQRAWHALNAIPYGTTCSYIQQATLLNKHTAFRAVARANSKNRLAIIVPCHRVINKNGNVAGYAGGIARKEWLIMHEKTKKLVLENLISSIH